MATCTRLAGKDPTPLAKNDDLEPALDQLGGLIIAETYEEQNEEAPSLLAQGLDLHRGQSDERDLVLDDDSRAKEKAVVELSKDVDQRKKFLKDANITNKEDLDDMWEATAAWLNHATHPVPERLIEFVDDAVKNLMPPDTVIDSICPHGVSSWSRSACIETTVGGEQVTYFIKATPSTSGKIMFQGELESLRAIHAVTPDFCPEPIGSGPYESDTNVYFFLSHYVEMLNEPPDPETLPEKLAELHRKAVAPDGKYGFHVPTTAGLLPIKVAKGRSWEDYFVRYMRYLLLAERLAQVPPKDVDEYQRLINVLFDRLIPRLLRPLETGGREIKPRLLHTNIWHGNTSINIENGRPLVYDACAVYGHNEFDLGVWTCPRTTFGPIFLTKYHNFFERSSPEEDYDARHTLYLMAFELRASVTLVRNGHCRDEFMKYLGEIDKALPETYEEWATARGEEPQPMKTP